MKWHKQLNDFRRKQAPPLHLDSVLAGSFLSLQCPPHPHQVDRSVLEALPAELRDQVERSWGCRQEQAASPPPASSSTHCTRRLILQIPGQQGQADPSDIVLALPDFSQVGTRLLHTHSVFACQAWCEDPSRRIRHPLSSG